NKSAVTVNASRVVIRVDPVSFKKAINYKISVCPEGATISEEFFFVQLTSRGEVSAMSAQSNSAIPTCWNVRDLNDYLNSCSESAQGAATAAKGPPKPGVCKPINLCSCSSLKPSYSCTPKSCPVMYSVCHP
ncbi:MAG: hypothetical protein ABIO44_05485, partial [Saprospiraceae bacterium]